MGNSTWVLLGFHLGDYLVTIGGACLFPARLWASYGHFSLQDGGWYRGPAFPFFCKWTEVRKYSILSRMQDWPRFTRYLKGVHWAFRVSNKMYIPFVPIWTKDSFLLYLVGHKTQLFIVILQIRAGRKFLGHFALLHRKVANPATTNCSFADSIHESFFYLVFFC